MDPERWRRATAVFHDALSRAPDQRAGFLDAACRDDSDVRGEVERLLAAHENAGAFGDAPLAIPPFATALEPSIAATTTADVDDLSAPPSASSSTVSPRRLHPFFGVTALAAIVTIATFSYAASVLVSTRGAEKVYGWREVPQDGDWVVSTVVAGGPAAGSVAPGDRVRALNGVAPSSVTGTYIHRLQLSVGEPYQLTLARGSEQLERTITVAGDRTRLPHYLTYYFTSLVWCVVGLFIGLARPDDRVARVAFGAAILTGLQYVTVAVVETLNLVNPLHVILGVHFFSIFPSGRRLRGLWKWLLALGYAVSLVIIALGVWRQATIKIAGMAGAASLVARHPRTFAVLPLAAVDVFYLALVGMLGAAVYSYRHLTDENERRRVKWVAYGSMLSLAPQVVLSIGELTIGAETAGLWLGQFADAASAGIPIAVAYAVVKHRVFDIRVVVRRGLQYLMAKGALQALVAVPLAALAYTVAVNRDRTVGELLTESTGYLYWIAIAALTLRYRQRVRLWIDRRFFREEYDREQLLLGLLDDLGRVDSVAQLSALVDPKLESALHPASVCFWYRDPDEFNSVSSSNPRLTAADFPAGGRWLEWLEDRTAAVELPLPPEAGLSKAQARWFAARDINLAVPIADSDERLAGVLLLGPKKSEEPYGANDRRLLLAIAKQMAVVRENLRLKAQVSDEQRIRHDVLAHLDRQNVNLLKECPRCGACFDAPAERCDRDGATLTMSLPVARTVDGKYRLDRLIGKGGMGAVYEARDLRLARDVAVKILLGREFGQQTALRRFRREARAAARLDHPHIVRVYDYGSLEGEGAYIVMERLQGSTLRAELCRVRTIRPAEAADWFDQILAGLAAAHEQGIVHRDLKPENIIGRRDEGSRLVVTILDFGLAKDPAAIEASTETMTVPGAVMGTFGYMSPEQLLGRVVDQRTDIFAVGVMLAETITGRRPFDGDTTADVSRAVLYEPYHLAGSSADLLAIDDVLQRCLAKDPGDRIASAETLRQALVPALRRVAYA